MPVARSFGIGVAADHEFLALQALHLQPRPRRAGSYGASRRLETMPSSPARRPRRRTPGRSPRRDRCSAAGDAAAARRAVLARAALRSSRAARGERRRRRGGGDRRRSRRAAPCACRQRVLQGLKAVGPSGSTTATSPSRSAVRTGSAPRPRPRWGSAPSSPCRCGSEARPAVLRGGPGCGSRRTSSRAATRRPSAARRRASRAAAAIVAGSGALRAPGTAAAAAARSRRAAVGRRARRRLPSRHARARGSGRARAPFAASPRFEFQTRSWSAAISSRSGPWSRSPAAPS